MFDRNDGNTALDILNADRAPAQFYLDRGHACSQFSPLFCGIPDDNLGLVRGKGPRVDSELMKKTDADRFDILPAFACAVRAYGHNAGRTAQP